LPSRDAGEDGALREHRARLVRRVTVPDEVRARLDLGRKPVEEDIDSNRQAHPCHDRVDAGTEATAGEH
jgi:hypothetical protein